MLKKKIKNNIITVIIIFIVFSVFSKNIIHIIITIILKNLMLKETISIFWNNV